MHALKVKKDDGYHCFWCNAPVDEKAVSCSSCGRSFVERPEEKDTEQEQRKRVSPSTKIRRGDGSLYCFECGHNVEADAKTCTGCGRIFTGVRDWVPPKKGQEKPTSGIGNAVGIGCAVAVALPLLGLLLCSVCPSRPSTKPGHLLSRAGTGPIPEFVTTQDVSPTDMLSSAPNGRVVGEIPGRVRLEVLAHKHVQQNPELSVYWYKVRYNGKTGWISEFVTTKW